ncbi:MAG: Tricarboxylate transport protein TctC [Ramlibacter sp.]|jgi:tripartite-type tricarboxylate transporter receptor subunit TctC|nr:Tricarboxylate transport protein TctC [Ramlibacter sp.]
MISRRTFSALALGAVSLAPVTGPALAQSKFPGKPLRILVPFPPGGSTDILARALAAQLTASMGVPVVVENKPGASGTMGSEILARAAPDGYTIGIAVPGTHTLPVALGRKVPYDPFKDFTPLSIPVTNPLAIVVSADLPVRTLKELVEYAKKNPRKLSYGTSGAGTSQHLMGEMLNQFAGIDIQHVPYKGGSGAMNDLLGKQIQVTYAVIATVLQHVRAGKLKILAVADDQRYADLPDVPTTQEALPGFQPKTSWMGVFGPAKLPAAIASYLTAELQKAVRDPEVGKYLSSNGMPVVGSNAEQFTARMREDIEGWTPVIRAGKITAD